MPIKLNKSYWYKFLTNLLPSADDPRILLEENVNSESFSTAISSFKFGTTFKTTKNFRFPTMLEILKSLDYHSEPVVLDVGASDGITSFHITQSLDFKKYYVTDLNIEVFYQEKDGKYYFYDEKENCILMTNKFFVIYSDFNDSFFPFSHVAKYLYSKVPTLKNNIDKIELINPKIKNAEGNIVIKKYDLFEKWEESKIDLIIAANILNRVYFSDIQLAEAIDNFLYALNENGRFVIIDNRAGEDEKGTVFRVTNAKIEAEKDVNGGTEIKEFILTL